MPRTVTHITTRITATLTATTILAIALAFTTTATARNLTMTFTSARVVWARLELRNTVITEQTVRCPVTLEGSFHSQTIRKVSGALIGHITRAAVHNPVCTGGNATLNQETLPWHITYESFRGTLPRITEIAVLLTGMSFIIRSGGSTCRGTSAVGANNAGGIVNLNAAGQITELKADESRSISLVNGPGGALCGLARGIFSGSGNVTELGTGNLVFIRLI